MHLLLFALDDARYAVRTEPVVEIVRAVAVTRLPNAPPVIEGVIDVRGQIASVFDLRRRFGLPLRAIDVADQLIVARASGRLVALHVDRALDLAEVDDSAIAHPPQHTERGGHIAGIAALPDGLVLIHDLDAFLSAAEAESLDRALHTAAEAPAIA